ncbi:MAG: hypothetical protein IJN23_02020 [Akkermansia sp.]|nr:hypothetical protein [Akkermansia sp.]
MKRTLALSLILAALAMPLKAVEWSSETTGDQTVTEDVTVTGTANVGNITFNGDSTVSGSGSIGGSGNLTVSSGTVVFDGVSRPGSTGNITIAAGATLELKNEAVLVQSEWTNTANVNISGTLKVENLKYGIGQLGGMGSNSWLFKMYGGSTADAAARLEITKSGEATRGVKLQTSGTCYTVAVSAGQTFSWINETGESTGIDTIDASSASGSRLTLEAGAGATFILHKDIGSGLTVDKTGEGVLVVNSTVNISGEQRCLEVSNGTLRLGENANIQSVGTSFNVKSGATFDLDGRGGNSGIAVTVRGEVINGQNNEMNISLGENATFSISADATSGYNGSLVLTEGATIDLGGYVFYNSIDISAGGELKNSEKHRGSIMLGVDENRITSANSETLVKYGSSLASAGSIEVSLTENFAAEAPDFELLRGRLYAAEALSIEGTGEESVSISGYQSEYGALSAQNGDISITGVVDVTLSNNSATNETVEDYNRAGALSATGNVTVEAAGKIVVSGNSASVNSTSAGAVYAGMDVSLSGASISITGNSVGGEAEDSFSGGALRGDLGSIYLTSTEGDIEIRGNTAAESGGALYASTGVEINAAGDISITGNAALTADGGAIYSDGDVSISNEGAGGVTITSNTAGGNGGAIYSNGTVCMSGGSYEVSGNSAGSYGGAIYAESVEISADAGDITFSGNTHDGGTANDVELAGGTAALSASNGHTLEMQGGVTCAGEIAITTNADSVVRLGGTSSTESLRIEDGQVHGIYDADGNQAVINVSTSVTLSNACLQDIALVDEWGEAALTSSASSYVYNDAVGMLFETLDGSAVNCTSSAPLLNGFASVDGDLSIGLTADFLNAALAEAGGEAVNISLTLLEDTTNIGEEGSFTLSLDAALVGRLNECTLEEYGFYDAEDNWLGYTVELTEAGGVVFSIIGLDNLIPEPTTTTLSLLALCTLCARRRRR